jgi:uncharacterized RDD family membrane protein YckC
MHRRDALSPADALSERVGAAFADGVLALLAYYAAGGGGAGIAALAAVTLLNLGVAQGLTGYSLGKAMTGVRAARVETTEPPGLAAGLLRWVLLPVDLAVVGIVLTMSSERRQRLGDRVARTWVVQAPPVARWRGLAGFVYCVLALALLTASSTRAGLAVTGIFVPFGLGAAVAAVCFGRRLATWPWIAGLSFCLVAATYMSAVDLCDPIAGTCVKGDLLTSSRQAVFSVVAFAVGLALLRLRRSAARDAAFALVVLAGEGWLLVQLIDRDATPLPQIVAALIALQLVYELLTRVRRGEPAAA